MGIAEGRLHWVKPSESDVLRGCLTSAAARQADMILAQPLDVITPAWRGIACGRPCDSELPRWDTARNDASEDLENEERRTAHDALSADPRPQ